MYWDAKKVTPLPDYLLQVELLNGLHGTFDMKPFLDKGIFKQLHDPAYFAQASIEWGAITWPNGQDIAPETIYEAIRQQHSPRT